MPDSGNPFANHIISQSADDNISSRPGRIMPLGAHNIVRGWRAIARHPLYLLRPGGGDGCREAELVFGGDGPCDPSPGYVPPAGATDASGSPLFLRRCRAAARQTSCLRPISPEITRYACPP